MRRTLLIGLAIVLPLSTTVSGQSAPSVADVARANRERLATEEASGIKPKVITNKDLPSDPGEIPESSDSRPMTMVSGVSRADAERYAGQPFTGRYGHQEQASEQWRERIQVQESRIGDLQARIDQADAQIHAYGSTVAPNRYQARQMERLAQMKEVLDQQKQRLAMMQEAARRAGMHSTIYDP